MSIAQKSNGNQLLAAQGRAVRQGPQNFAGRAGAAAPQQVADVPYNRASPPKAPQAPKKLKPTHGGVPGPMGPPSAVRGPQTNPNVAGVLGQSRTLQSPSFGMQAAGGKYNGFMPVQQQGSLASALQGDMKPPQQQPQVLGAAVPTDTKGGGERADQSLMGPKTLAGSPQEFGENLKEAWDAWGPGGSGYSRDSKDPTVQTGYAIQDFSNELARPPAGAGLFTGEGPGGGGQGNPMANALVQQIGDILSGLSGTMSAEDMANLNKYFGESTGAYREIMDTARGLNDPAARNAWEDAARADMQASVNADKNAAMRALNERIGRGGAMSSNAVSSIYGNAAQALAQGERGLAQDRYGRDFSAAQAAMQGLGAGGSALQDLLGEGFTSNKEVLSYLLTGMQKGADIGNLLADITAGKFV